MIYLHDEKKRRHQLHTRTCSMTCPAVAVVGSLDYEGAKNALKIHCCFAARETRAHDCFDYWYYYFHYCCYYSYLDLKMKSRMGESFE